jgi:hypothetical protein
MSSSPLAARTFKGAIIGLDPANPLASVIIFQYNPDAMTRTIRALTTGDTSRGEALRLKGPPQEEIRCEIAIDATDQLAAGDGMAESMGIYPALSALEMLLYPKSALVIANQVLMLAGVIEVIPPEQPLAVLVWGAKRVLPFRLSDFTIAEQMYDPDLNPIRASVTLNMKVLSYYDLGLVSVGGAMFMAHQIVKEVMATINGVGSIASVVGG